jgi:hypothetical protein
LLLSYSYPCPIVVCNIKKINWRIYENEWDYATKIYSWGTRNSKHIFKSNSPAKLAENYAIAYYKTYSGIINASLKSKQNFCSGTLRKNYDAMPEILQSTLQNTESIVLGNKKR